MSCRRNRSVRSLALGALTGCLLVASACSSSPDSRGQDPDSASTTPADASGGAPEGEPGAGDLDAAFDALRESGFNGVVLVDKGGEVRVEGFGEADREAGVANDGTTVFDVGSITKQFTGAAVLRLQMDGRLSVDDPVSDYLPELAGEPGNPGDKGEITLHQLLTHTAGLPEALGDDDEPTGRAEYLRLVAETPLQRPPGDEYAYSNVGYSVLAAVIEVVTGGSYEEYLRTALFEPAGMSSTGYVLPDWDGHVIAVGYEGDEDMGRPDEIPWADDGPYWHLRGNGGLLSTAEDMHRWHRALLGDEILDAAAKEALYGRHTTEGPDAPSYYGYGWAIFPTPWDTWLIAHDGGNGIFFADFLRFLDEDVTIFLASNADDTVEQDAALRIASAVLGAELAPPTCGVDDLAGLDIVDGFGDAEAGATVAELFEILADAGGEDADDTTARAFIEDHVAGELAGGRSTDELLVVLRELQAELSGFTIDAIAREDPSTFHVRLRVPAAGEVIVSVRTSDGQPDRIGCIDI